MKDYADQKIIAANFITKPAVKQELIRRYADHLMANTGLFRIPRYFELAFLKLNGSVYSFSASGWEPTIQKSGVSVFLPLPPDGITVMKIFLAKEKQADAA